MSDDTLLRYHPERYRRTRPFSKKIASMYRSSNGINPPLAQSFDAINDIIINTYNGEISLMPIESRPAGARMLMLEPSMAINYAAYCAYGRNLFHLNNVLLQEFLHTDVDSVSIGLVDFPYDCFYISFGSIQELTLYQDNCYVDGAYVFAFDGFPLQIILTTSRSDWNYSNRYEWIFNPDRYYYMSMDRNDASATFGTLINKALKDEIARHKSNKEMCDSGVYEVEGKLIGLINKSHESSEKNREEITVGFNSFKRAMNLVVNTLCYVSQYKNEVKESWPENTPPSLLKKLDMAKTPKQNQRAISKLVSMGYTKIKVCGSSFEKHKLSSIGSEISPHWRRGHWRQQPFGEGMKKQKIIWIRPTIVRRDKGSPDLGHIYEV